MSKWIDANDANHGNVGFLIESARQGGPSSFQLRSSPGRTNGSCQPRLYGWLGETNNVSVTAHGLWRVVKLSNSGERALIVQLTDIEVSSALEELGWPELLERAEA